MKTKDYIIYGIIAVVFGLLGMFLTKTFTPKCANISVVTKHDTLKADTVKKDIKIYQPVYVYHDTGTYKVITKIDTVKVVNDYFAYKAYHRELLNDTTALIVLNDTVHRNGLLVGKLTYLNRQPTAIYNNTYQTITNPSVNQMYIGGVLSGSTNAFGVGARIVLKTKKDALWGIETQYIPQLSKHMIFSVSHDIKIHF